MLNRSRHNVFRNPFGPVTIRQELVNQIQIEPVPVGADEKFAAPVLYYRIGICSRSQVHILNCAPSVSGTRRIGHNREGRDFQLCRNKLLMSAALATEWPRKRTSAAETALSACIETARVELVLFPVHPRSRAGTYLGSLLATIFLSSKRTRSMLAPSKRRSQK